MSFNKGDKVIVVNVRKPLSGDLVEEELVGQSGEIISLHYSSGGECTYFIRRMCNHNVFFFEDELRLVVGLNRRKHG